MIRIVIVSGSRDLAESERVMFNEALSSMRPEMVVEGGNGNGADRFAREWAAANGIENRTFMAEWDVYGRRAGPIRNGKMLAAYPDAVVLVFPRGGRGTRDCIRQAKERKMLVIEK